VSSHVLSEVQLLADDVVIIAGGRLVRQCATVELTGAGRDLEGAFLELTAGGGGIR
jgi:ABC-2 type transport system ATP-binding protein